MASEQKTKGNRRVLMGIVAGDKMDKSVVVKVTRFHKHRLYKKFVHETKRYQAHDEQNNCHVGDKVTIVECRPLSKNKRWRVNSIVDRAKN
jgi:small subunit ribosomal protein S17